MSRNDSIDFASGKVPVLFRKMFIPTLLGMVSMVILNLADGAFIGHGAGTVALAAINIAAPVFNLMTGIGIMFGIGTSVVSSILLAKGDIEEAEKNTTHALTGSLVMTGLLSVVMLTHLPQTCRLFGSSEELIEPASRYLRWVAGFMPFCMLGMVGGFIVRLDGSPRFAMACTLVASILNIILDWLFIFPLQMGLEGAAIATSISFTISALILLYYLRFRSNTLHLRFRRPSLRRLKEFLDDLKGQMKAGVAGMLGEIAISGIMIAGNFVFIHYLGEDGVAAYGAACYCMPVIFMLGNAIVESSQPIISFAYGSGDRQRQRESRKVALTSAVVAGVGFTVLMTAGAPLITLLFIPAGENAYRICVEGLPWFGSGCVFIALNLVLIGYLQSIERAAAATAFTLLRGFILVIPAFLLLPMALGTDGIWLAIPVSETLTFLSIIAYSARKTGGLQL